MTINVERDFELVTLEITGRIDTTTAPNLESVVKELSEDTRELIFDMSGVEYISSAGIRVLLGAYKKMNSNQGRSRIEKVNDMVREVFEMAGRLDGVRVARGGKRKLDPDAGGGNLGVVARWCLPACSSRYHLAYSGCGTRHYGGICCYLWRILVRDSAPCVKLCIVPLVGWWCSVGSLLYGYRLCHFAYDYQGYDYLRYRHRSFDHDNPFVGRISRGYVVRYPYYE